MGSMLEVALSMSLIYFLFSVICSGINELLAWALSLRAETLWAGLGDLLAESTDDKLLAKLASHPLVAGLSPRSAASDLQEKQASSRTAHLPKDFFVAALLDLGRRARAEKHAASQVFVPQEKAAELARAVLALRTTETRDRAAQAEKLVQDFQLPGQGIAAGLVAAAERAPLGPLFVAAERVEPTVETLASAQKALDASPEGAAQKSARDAAATDAREAWVALLLLVANPARALATGDAALAELRADLEALPWSRARRATLALLDETVTDVAAARARLGSWFDAGMRRVSERYARRAKRNVLLIALGVSLLGNVDSIQLVRTLLNDAPRRAAVVAAAETVARAQRPASGAPPTPEEATRQLRTSAASIAALDMPLWWTPEPFGRPLPSPSAWDYLAKVLGLLFSALALSMGAPFWFDALNKLVNLRSTGEPPPRATPPAAS